MAAIARYVPRAREARYVPYRAAIFEERPLARLCGKLQVRQAQVSEFGTIHSERGVGLVDRHNRQQIGA